jgi:hypothetical protein
MVEKDPIIKEKIKYSGLGDLKSAYKYAREWLENEGFNLIEDSYSEKISGSSKEIEIEWTAARKMTDYFKVTLKLKWRILGMSDVEVEIDGRKKNMNKFSDFSIEIKGVLEKDYSNKWEGSAMNKFFKDVYNKYVIPQRTDEKEGQVVGTVQSFKEEMKAYLELTGRK